MNGTVLPITLSARNISHHFNGAAVVRDVSLELRKGEVVGLLGHNGAGKSTTLRMLSGVLATHTGQIEICGINLNKQPESAKAHIGFLPENPPLYRDMRVQDFLKYTGRLHRIATDKLAEALDRTMRHCGLQEVSTRFIGTLSKGYQQRVGLAQAIMHDPDVIILDEPTVSLDPAQIREVRTLIRELGNHHSVILSTHLIGEAESICDRFGILHGGSLVFNGSREDLIRLGDGNTDMEEMFIQLTTLPGSTGHNP